MKSCFKLLILITCMIALPVIVFAQDSLVPQTVDLADGYTLSIPADWKLTEVNNGVFSVQSDEVTVSLLLPAHIASLGLNISNTSSLVYALIDRYGLMPKNGKVGLPAIQQVIYGDYPAYVYRDLDGVDQDEMDVVLDLSGGSLSYFVFVVPKGQLTPLRSTISAIITSFKQTGTSGVGITGAQATESAGSGTSATGGASEVNCTVSTDSASSAQLRVGPGTNRGAISFLPANVDVTVTGRIVLKDGSIWYQLDKAQAAPKGTAAAELWVSADDVTGTGDCNHVGDTTAPPVIPGHIAPPPTITTTTNATPVPGDTSSANSAPGSLPTPGRWTITYNPTTNISCRGTNNFPTDSNEVYASLTYTFFLDGVDANSFKYGGDLLTRIPGTNSFSGSFTFDDGTNMQARYDLASPTVMTGQEVGNAVVDGTPCSATVLVTITRN